LQSQNGVGIWPINCDVPTEPFSNYLCTAALGYLVAAVSPSMEIANSLYPAYVVSLLFFVGLLIRMPDIPNYWKWNVYINPLQCAFPIFQSQTSLQGEGA